jgi:hypothetical protein
MDHKLNNKTVYITDLGYVGLRLHFSSLET